MIEIKNLTVGFNRDTVLEDISLVIPQNEITVIVGRSGCGKSVLMKTIERLFYPFSGKVFVDGIDIFSLKRKEMKEMRKRLAMLFQGSALLDSLSVFQNVALPLYEHTDLSEEEIFNKVTENLKLMGLEDVLDKMPAELSGGMKKRVALARAIILKPEYIIYDEPTTGLDPIIADEIINLILKMRKAYKLTSIIVTHDLDCIRKIAGRVAMIHEKKIIFDGSYKEFKNSDDIRVQNFMRVS